VAINVLERITELGAEAAEDGLRSGNAFTSQ